MSLTIISASAYRHQWSIPVETKMDWLRLSWTADCSGAFQQTVDFVHPGFAHKSASGNESRVDQDVIVVVHIVTAWQGRHSDIFVEYGSHGIFNSHLRRLRALRCINSTDNVMTIQLTLRDEPPSDVRPLSSFTSSRSPSFRLREAKATRLLVSVAVRPCSSPPRCLFCQDYADN